MISIQLENIDKVVRQLQDFAGGSSVALMRGIARTGLDIQTAAKLRLQQRGHWITGRLASSIHSEVKDGVLDNKNKKITGTQYSYEAPKTGVQFDGTFTSKAGDMELLVGTNVEYAARIELGFKGTDSMGRKYNQSGDSYLRYAATLAGGKIGDYIKQQLDRLVVASNQDKMIRMDTRSVKYNTYDWEASYE